jgi:hypothetical protein
VDPFSRPAESTLTANATRAFFTELENPTKTPERSSRMSSAKTPPPLRDPMWTPAYGERATLSETVMVAVEDRTDPTAFETITE